MKKRVECINMEGDVCTELGFFLDRVVELKKTLCISPSWRLSTVSLPFLCSCL